MSNKRKAEAAKQKRDSKRIGHARRPAPTPDPMIGPVDNGWGKDPPAKDRVIIHPPPRCLACGSLPDRCGRCNLYFEPVPHHCSDPECKHAHANWWCPKCKELNDDNYGCSNYRCPGSRSDNDEFNQYLCRSRFYCRESEGAEPELIQGACSHADAAIRFRAESVFEEEDLHHNSRLIEILHGGTTGVYMVFPFKLLDPACADLVGVVALPFKTRDECFPDDPSERKPFQIDEETAIKYRRLGPNKYERVTA